MHLLCSVSNWGFVIDAPLLPCPPLPTSAPPHSSPLCVDAQKKRIVFQVTLSNHSP